MLLNSVLFVDQSTSKSNINSFDLDKSLKKQNSKEKRVRLKGAYRKKEWETKQGQKLTSQFCEVSKSIIILFLLVAQTP